MLFKVILCWFNLLIIVFLSPVTLRKEDSIAKVKQRLRKKRRKNYHMYELINFQIINQK